MGEVASVERVPASLLPRRPLPVKCSCVWAWAAKGAEKPSETDPCPFSREDSGPSRPPASVTMIT